MYQWLLGALGALFAVARRPTPPSGPPPRKRPLPSVSPLLEDPDQTECKKRKPDYGFSGRKEKVEGVSGVVNLPSKAKHKHRKASVSHAAPREPAGEAWSTSDSSPERPTDSALDVEMIEIDNMPCATDTCLNKETLSFYHRTIPCLSASRNGKHYIKPAPDSVLTLRPPIKERAGPESTASEANKTGRPFCTAEEGVQQEEKKKYKQLLELVKEKYPRSCPNPQPTSFRNVQAGPKEPVTTVSHLEEQKYGGDFYPRVTLKTGDCPRDSALLRCAGVKYAEVHNPQWPQGGDMIRYCTPAENSREQARPGKQATAGRQHGAATSKELLSRLAPVLSRKSPPLDVEEKKFMNKFTNLEEKRFLKLEEKQFPKLEKAAERFSPLTEAMEREIVAAFRDGDPGEIMSSAFKLRVTREDIHTLQNLRWLNDEIINFYMSLLVERNKKEGYPSVHAFSTFFYPKLISEGYKAVRRWTRGVDLFKQDIVLVPIHLRVHWALAVIDVRKKTIKYFDSMAQKGSKICDTLFRYLQEESREKRNQELNISEWTLHNMEPHEIPQQTNGSDCGVFTCKFADYISRDKPITFTQNNMPYFRKKMVWEIIHQQLL
ncbi:sentrin-specific protease 2 [Patagioenas fasciata monilis]|uniref:Sentrin-specific protease 2 n=1 Tax=Patagioenas fasciata monilis TaxID=372326 RepID=A0A1V4KSH2_PATFA|nr:sentrin-specific protease 2 [Patagioenas fasciata monilis]